MRFSASRPVWHIGIGAVLVAVLSNGCFSVSRPSLEKQYFVLDVEREAPVPPGTTPRELWVAWVRIDPEFQGREFVYRTGEYAYQPDFYNAFLIPPEKLIGDQLYRWLLDAGLEKSAPAPSRGADTWTLYVNVPKLYADLRNPGQPKALLHMKVFVEAPVKEGGGIVFHHDYSREISLKDNSVTTIVAGWNQALREIFSALESDLRGIDWTSAGEEAS